MIYPAVPECTGEELTNNLIEQIKAFKTNFHLNERVEEIKKVEKKWITLKQIKELNLNLQV